MDGNSPVTPLSKASPFIARRFLHSFVSSVIVLGNWGMFLTGLWETPVKNRIRQKDVAYNCSNFVYYIY